MNLTEIILLLAAVIGFFFFCWLILSGGKGGSHTQAARLQRIRNASFWVQVLLVISFVMGGYTLLAFFMGWGFATEPHVRIVVSEHHIYTSPADMPNEVLAYWLVKMFWSFVCSGLLFALFNLYRRGIFFSAKNTRLIRALGYYLMVDWLIDYLLQGAVRDMQLSTTPLFIGLIIIFVSWIMDEGRKIQEEQELTV